MWKVYKVCPLANPMAYRGIRDRMPFKYDQLPKHDQLAERLERNNQRTLVPEWPMPKLNPNSLHWFNICAATGQGEQIIRLLGIPDLLRRTKSNLRPSASGYTGGCFVGWVTSSRVSSRP